MQIVKIHITGSTRLKIGFLCYLRLQNLASETSFYASFNLPIFSPWGDYPKVKYKNLDPLLLCLVLFSASAIK